MAVALWLSGSAWGAGLDRDAVLAEAPATPEAGTVRVAGGGNASWVGGPAGGVSGTVMWAIFTHFAADLGVYWQDGELGPAVRVRYQFLNQGAHGVDMAAGVRYKSVGLDPRNGELEVLVAAGRRFGALEAMLDLVGGTELGGPGLDVELKGLVGYRVTETLRVGVDLRAQAEVRDETGFKQPDFGADVAAVGGAAVSWMPVPALQLQLLLGATKPRGSLTAGPTGQLFATFDF
jgi:hypothetical protein